MARTHYEVLGITHAASTEEIRRAFRAAARKLHPDVSESKNSETRFAEASAAYEVLSDPQARRAYDEQLHAARTSHEGVPSGQAHYTWTNVATHATKEGGPFRSRPFSLSSKLGIRPRGSPCRDGRQPGPCDGYNCAGDHRLRGGRWAGRDRVHDCRRADHALAGPVQAWAGH